MGYEASEIRDACRGRWSQVLSRWMDASLLTPGHSACPGCGGRDRFRFDDKEGEGTFICSQGGGGLLSSDGIGLLMHAKGCSFPEACTLLGEALGLEPIGMFRNSTSNEREKMNMGTAEPKRAEPEKATYSEKALRGFYRPELGIDEAWVMERSPVDPFTVEGAGEFLDALFAPDERVLIFSKYKSQGQFMRWCGKGFFRLGAENGIKAVPAPDGVPARGSEDGAWFLCCPVTGRWVPKQDRSGNLTRRSGDCATRFPYMVLESDEAPPELWLCFLAQLPLPIAAIYTSGGRSIHALIKCDCGSKAGWDALRGKLLPLLVKLGADQGALSAVRLTRLPFCDRKVLACKCGAVTGWAPRGKPCKACGEYVPPERGQWREQKLLFLNPKADGAPLWEL